MKKYVLAFIFIFAFVSQGFSADPGTADMVQLSQAKNPSALSLVVTSDGKLITKPGASFSKGNYKGVRLPYLVSTPKPISYPRWAVQENWEGNFVVAVEILTDGSVGRSMVMKSTGHSNLDETVTQIVKTWKFHPAMKGDEPVVECVQVPIAFRLRSE